MSAHRETPKCLERARAATTTTANTRAGIRRVTVNNNALFVHDTRTIVILSNAALTVH